MCNPAMIAMAAISVASSAMSAKQQADAAEKTMEAQNEATKLQIRENNKAAALDKLEKQRETMRKVGAAQAGAADAGVGGNSMLREYATLEIQGQHDEGIIESSRKGANAAAEAQAGANAASYESKIAAANSTMIGGLAQGSNHIIRGLK